MWEERFRRSYGFWRGLVDEVVEPVGHAQWVFTIPKMLRIYFLRHRELLGALSRAAYETVQELMAAAVEEKDFRPMMVSVIQTFGEGAKFHPQRSRSRFTRRLLGFGGVDSPAVCGRGSGREALPPQGARSSPP